MRINYNKTITDDHELKPFLSPTEPEFVDRFVEYSDDAYVVKMVYDVQGLQKALLDRAETGLKSIGFKTTRSAANTLWASEPDKLSLGLEARVTRGYGDPRMDQTVKKGTKTKKGTFSRREIPVYWEVPSVSISGQVCYEAFEGVEPTPVLNVLNNLGYAARVIPTPQELQEALERLRQARGSSRHTSHYHHSDSGMMGVAAGFLIGAGLFGD